MIIKRVVLELSSIILLKAVCASDVISSASSNIIILYGFSSLPLYSPFSLIPLGSLITAANSLTLSRTIFIPLSSDALSSRVSLFHSSPNNSIDKHNAVRSEEHTSELQSRQYLVCRLLLEKKKYNIILTTHQ